MCDYSLQNVRSRPAKVGDKLVTKNFRWGTSGFADYEDEDCAVCVKPGTEIAFSNGETAIFRQINKDEKYKHHDALEWAPDGRIELLTRLKDGRRATILQMPAAPKTKKEAEDQERLEITA